MQRYFFRLGGYFGISVINKKDKEGLSRVAEESNKENISDFHRLENRILPYNAHIGKKRDEIANLTIHTIPFTIKKLPVWYEHPAGNLLIGNVEVEEEK